MEKWQKLADYVMSSKMDKFVYGILIFTYAYIIIQIVRWFVC